MTPSPIEEQIKVRIKNIGKLNDAEIRVGQFTVFAGPNSTGKSSVSKLLYSFFDAVRPHIGEIYLKTIVQDVCEELKMMARLYEDQMDEEITKAINKLNMETEKLLSLADAVVIDSLSENISKLGDQTDMLIEVFDEVMRFEMPKRHFRDAETGRIMVLLQKLKELQITPEGCIVNGLSLQIAENLVNNFQIPNASDLIGTEEAHLPAEVEIDDFGVFQLSRDRDEVRFVPNDNKSFTEQLRYYSRYSEVIYLESPIHWKIKRALIHNAYRFLPRSRRPLPGVPGYFLDLVRRLGSNLRRRYGFSRYICRVDRERCHWWKNCTL